MVEQGMTPISLDVFNSKINKILEKLPKEKKAELQVSDQSGGGFVDSLMDR